MFSQIQSKLQARGYWAEALAPESTNIVGGSLSAVDQIANLLTGVEEKVETKVPENKQIEESEEADTQPDDFTQDDEVEGEEESTEEAEQDDSDEEVTWAKTLGVDDKNVVLDEDGNLAGINVKVDGKVSTVEVKDLIAGYQSNKSNTNKSKALADERREFDGLKVAVATEYQKKIEAVTKLTDHLKSSLLGDYQNIDWNRLRAENPGEYAAAVQDFNFRNNEIEQVLNAVNEEKTGIQQQQTVEQQQAMGEYLKSQASIILEKNPTWAKPEVAKKAISDMSNFIEEAYGFTAAEFGNIQDARLLEVIKDAMAFRNNVKVAKTKLEVTIPKFQKSNGKTVKAVTKLDRLVKQAKTATGYHKKTAEIDAIAELLSGSN
jgi:hypothetical protein